MTNEALIDFYRRRISQKGLSYAAVWGDEAEWKAAERFRIIEPTDIKEGDTVVDLGSGIGLLKAYMDHHRINGEYIAVDAVSDFLEAVRMRYGCAAHNVDFFNRLADVPDADWYAMFGSLNKKWLAGLSEDDNVDTVYDWIAACFDKSRKGLFLSCFTDRAVSPKPQNIHLSPFRIVEVCGPNCRSFRIRHDTPFFEFTMMMTKQLASHE